MAVSVAVFSAIAPGFMWLWVFTHGRSYRGAPLGMLLATFLLGMLSTIPVGIIYSFILDVDIQEFAEADFATVAAAMFFIVGPVEESSKFLAVRLGVYRTRHLNEPLDGLIFGAAASLGFATAENIGYALAFGPEVMIVRGPISTLGHVVFGSIWALSLNPGAPVARRKIVGLGALAAAAAMHGSFNVLAFTSWGTLPAFGLVIVGAIVVRRMFRRTRSGSTYHLRRNMPLRVCPICSTGYRQHENFCTGCGTDTARLTPLFVRCANCREDSTTAGRFCSNCGDLFVYEE